MAFHVNDTERPNPSRTNMNTFISSQLLNDAEWQHALQQGFQPEDCNESPASRLRHEIGEGMKA